MIDRLTTNDKVPDYSQPSSNISPRLTIFNRVILFHGISHFHSSKLFLVLIFQSLLKEHVRFRRFSAEIPIGNF